MKKVTSSLEKFTRALRNMKWASPTANIKFNFLAGINRSITPSQVTKIATSNQRIGIIRPIVCAKLNFITGVSELYVLDGQHLLQSLLRLGLPIPYIVISIKDKKELVEVIALVNASSKNWCMLDYVTAWSSMIEDYVKLNSYYQRYDFEISILAAVLGEHEMSNGSNVTRFIKNGEFRIKNEERNVQILNYLTDVLSIVDRMNRYENRYFCQEYIKFVRNKKGYNHQLFLRNLKKYKKTFSLAINNSEKLKELFVRIS